MTTTFGTPSCSRVLPAVAATLILAGALVAGLGGCGGTEGGSCEGAQCEDAAAVDAAGDVPALDEVGPDVQADTDVPDAPPEGEFGEACTADADCRSGYCVESDEGRTCTQLCWEDCPEGYECRTLANSGGDAARLCVPRRDVLCRPCEVDLDCHGFGALCIEQADGTFCATRCTDAPCPEGYDCNRILVDGGAPDGDDLVTQVCEPAAGECPACDPNACGGCAELDAEPGSACGTCESGTWTCDDGGETLSCEGDQGEAARNACGGCAALDGTLGSACSACGIGSLVCDGEDALVCSCDTPVFEWVAGEWSDCPLNEWTLLDTTACSSACGPGVANASYSCVAAERTQTRTVECREIAGGRVTSDPNCSGDRPADTQPCTQEACAGADPSGEVACNAGNCVSCPAQTISVPTGSYGGAVCTDTLPAYEGPAGVETYSNRTWGVRCRGDGCLITSGCGETPYHGTVEGGTAGTCENYCAVRATCTAAGWVDEGFTW